jgi:cell division protease FtsH
MQVQPDISVAEVFQKANRREVESAIIRGSSMEVHLSDGTLKTADVANYQVKQVMEYLDDNGASVSLMESTSLLDDPLRVLIPILLGLLVVVALVAYQRRRGGMGNIFSMRKTNATLVDTPPNVTFVDVGGNEEAKQRLGDVVGFFRDPKKWQKTGARIPRGVLLEGPPGLGKTLLARALAGEAKVPLFNSSGSDFVELFVGVGAARVRDLFEVARAKAPCIVFIDELDAIGRKRGSASSSLTHQEREQALNQLLTCLDGFRPLDRVVVLAATNRSDVLDPALLRPGRFDVHLKISELSEESRLAVLQLHTKKKTLKSDVSLPTLARHTNGFSGAELELLANEAALEAVRRNRDAIETADFEAVLLRRRLQQPFTSLDAALIEGSHQMSVPLTRTRVRVAMVAAQIEGELAWVDPRSLKLVTKAGDVLLDRAHIVSIEPLVSSPLSEAALQTAHSEVGTA